LREQQTVLDSHTPQLSSRTHRCSIHLDDSLGRDLGDRRLLVLVWCGMDCSIDEEGRQGGDDDDTNEKGALRGIDLATGLGS